MPDSRRLEWYEGGTALTYALGVPFLLVGLAIAVAPLLGEAPSGGGALKALLVTVPFGLVFVALGFFLVFGRHRVVVDLDEGTVRRSWSALISLGGAERRLEEFDRVGLREEQTESGGHEVTIYCVRLEGEGSEFDLIQPAEYEQARLAAERVGDLLGWDIHEAAEGREVVREAGTFNESLRDRRQRLSEAVDVPPQPSGCRIACYLGEKEAVFRLPRRPLGVMGTWGVVVFLVVWVAPASGLLAVQWMRVGEEALGRGFVAAAAALFVLIPLLAMARGLLKHFTMRETLRIDSQRLALEQKWLLGRMERSLALAEIEDLGRDKECLTVVSDRESIDLGFGLGGEELHWLEAVIHALVSSPAGGQR